MFVFDELVIIFHSLCLWIVDICKKLDDILIKEVLLKLCVIGMCVHIFELVVSLFVKYGKIAGGVIFGLFYFGVGSVYSFAVINVTSSEISDILLLGSID